MAAQPIIEVTDNTRPFRNFGEQLQAVVKAASAPGRAPDPRLLEVQKRAAPFAGSAEQVPSEGGFLVGPEFSRELVRRMHAVGDILGRCMEVPLARQKLLLPQFNESSRANGSRLGGVQVFHENEAQAAVATKPNFQLLDLEAKKIIGLMYVTDELQMDSNALDAWAMYAFGLELAFTLENDIVTGTGAGQPLGVLKAPALVSIAKEGGQGIGTVVNANVQKMVARLWAPSRKNAIWIYNQAILPQLSSLTTTVGAAGSISNSWQYAWAEGEPDRLCGIAAYPSEYAKSPGTSGDLMLIDFSRYIIGMREALRGEVSIHVRFAFDESAFKFTLRCDGHPLDNTAITPLNGTDTTSPFVALADRLT